MTELTGTPEAMSNQVETMLAGNEQGLDRHQEAARAVFMGTNRGHSG